MSAKRIAGMDYRTGENLSLTTSEWREKFEQVIAKDGFKRRVGGDLCAFSASGKILFEMYDRDVTAAASVSS